MNLNSTQPETKKEPEVSNDSTNSEPVTSDSAKSPFGFSISSQPVETSSTPPEPQTSNNSNQVASSSTMPGLFSGLTQSEAP